MNFFKYPQFLAVFVNGYDIWETAYSILPNPRRGSTVNDVTDEIIDEEEEVIELPDKTEYNVNLADLAKSVNTKTTKKKWNGAALPITMNISIISNIWKGAPRGRM